MARHLALLEEAGVADEIIEPPDANLSHDFAGLVGDGIEIVDDHFRRAFELGAKLGIGCGDADGAGVEVALADVNATHGDHGGGAEVELLGAEDGGDNDVAAILDAAVGAEDNAVAEVVDDQRLLGLGQAQLPGGTSVFGGGKRGRAGTTVMTGDQDVVGGSLGDTSGDGAHSGLGDELDGDAGVRVDFLKVVDQLC